MVMAMPVAYHPRIMKITRLASLVGLAFAALLGLPASGFAQSILGSAGNFSILGGAAVSSTATIGTVISGGDVGSAASVTGFPPAVVTGGLVTTDTSVVDPALTDLMQAAAGLSNMTSDADESGLNLGGLTLYPGVYSFSSVAALDGTLTLNANGQNNAVWVFQVGSTLTTTANSVVTLINPGSNGGDDDGIYWDVGTGITFGTDNQILGNYLAGTSITVGSNTNGSGRALAQSAVSLDTNAINTNGGPNDSSWNSGLMYNAMGNVVPIPEPLIFLWLASLGVMVAPILWWHKTRKLKIIV